MKKSALGLALVLAFMPIAQGPIALNATTSYATTGLEGKSFKLNGVTYRYTGYAAMDADLFHQSEGTVNYGWMPDARYMRGQDPNTLLVDGDIFIAIFANDKFPKDKIPAEVYNAIYMVDKIDAKGKAVLKYHSSASHSMGEMFKMSEFHANFPKYKNGSLKKGDLVKIWHMFPTNGFEEVYIPEIYKYENMGKPTSNELLARSTFDTLIQVEAAKIMLEQSPKTVANIAPKLRKSIENSDSLVEEAFKVILNKNELTAADRDEAVVEMMRLYYGKEIKTETQKELALSVYKAHINSSAARTLLHETPNAVKNISIKLQDSIIKAEDLIYESLDSLI